MRPLIRNGDCLTVSPVDHLKIGDIVFFFSTTGRLVVHRINKIKNNLIITKGDAVLGEDYPVKREAVLGKVVMIERGGQKRDLGRGFWRLINFTFVITNPFLLQLRAVVRRVKRLK